MGAADAARAFVWRLLARRYSTMFGTARVYKVPWEDSCIRVLDVDGTYQSGTYVDDRWCEVPFPYLRLYDCVFMGPRPAHNVCMLGGGGYAFPRHVVAHHPQARIDVVEIDPAITRIARQHFFLDRLVEQYRTQENGRLGLICDDALTYVQEGAKDGLVYDAIINDCFAAASPNASFTTSDALEAVRRCLVEDGCYLTNVITSLEGEDAWPLKQLVHALSQVFLHVYALTCDRSCPTDPDNVVVVASQSVRHDKGAIELA